MTVDVTQAAAEPEAEPTAEQVQAETPAGAQNTDSQQPQEHMIPKSRFDEVNAELKRIKAQAAAEAKKQEAAEAERLKQAGEFKSLYEKAQAELEAERQRAHALELAGIKRDVAARLNLPAGLIDRLRGEDEAAIEADAKALLAALPKPPAPDINAGNGGGGNGGGKSWLGGLTEHEFAARFGVKPELLGKQ